MENFGKIMNIFNNILAEGISKKDTNSKTLFKKYLKAIKESDILRTQFLVYNNIETWVDDDVMSSHLFISENLRLLEKFKKADIIKENKKLVDLLGSKPTDATYALSDLHESISNLVFLKRVPENVAGITENIKKVTKHIINNNKAKVVNESFDLPNSMITNLMLGKFNEKYGSLDEADRKILTMLINSTLDEKKDYYSTVASECIALIDSMLKESNNDSKDKLLQAKDRLAQKVDLNEDNFTTKVYKLIELKNNLINS